MTQEVTSIDYSFHPCTA